MGSRPGDKPKLNKEVAKPNEAPKKPKKGK